MASGSRRRSRIVAFQTLFEAESAHKDTHEVLDRQLQETRLTEEAAQFAGELVDGVEAQREAIDAVISERAPAFPLEDMAAVDRNVLRLAIYEVLFDNR